MRSYVHSLCLSFLLVVVGFATPIAWAQTTYSVLHSFTGGTDGGYPISGLVRDASGTLYGATSIGGAAGQGTVFKVDATGQETVLYSFQLVPDGENPESSLVLDNAGNLYGTTVGGGTFSAGSVFKIDATGAESVLYSFTGGADGGYPVAGLLRDGSGNLYGTTSGGGDTSIFKSGYGVVFKLNARGKESVLYTFTDGADGGFPMTTLVRDAENNLYGTTYQGGTYQGGTVFKLDPIGKETALYSFVQSSPNAVILNAAGELFGTTNLGGNTTECFNLGCGTVFRLSSTGTSETALYNFSGQSDGSRPFAGVIADSIGNLYGTSWKGGTYGFGTVFKLDRHLTETVLYSFSGASDGAYPMAGLVRDAAGNLYGTTEQGGASGQGTVFELTFP
jgi:uncharacterized repeat protein (TIGR03803 family)